MTAPEPTQPLTDEGPASDRDKADMIAARREIQAVLDGRLPMDNAAYSAAIVMVLWKAGWRPRHLSTSMNRCDIADGWWRLGLGWRQRFQKAQDEADRLRSELDDLLSEVDRLRAKEATQSVNSADPEPVHFVRLGRGDTACEKALPGIVPWSATQGDFSSPTLTTRREKATCTACLAALGLDQDGRGER